MRVTMDEALFGYGKTNLTIDSKMLSQLWKICVETQNKDKNSHFEGQLELKFDYTAS